MNTFIVSTYADDLHTCIQTYGDNWQAYYAVSEIAYYHETGKLPEWALFIGRVDVVNDSCIFIHRDWGNAQ